MGSKLLKCYEFVESKGGMQGKMRLAMMTGIASGKAAGEADSDENVEKFRAAVKEITGEAPPGV